MNDVTAIKVETAIPKNPEGISRVDLLRKLWPHVNAGELDIVLNTLVQSNYIVLSSKKGGIFIIRSQDGKS